MKKNKGFTLVELIAAITILGVLLLIGSQVVIDTMNKNKAKAVYTSMDNVSKQARLTFLEDPETWEVNGEQAIKDSINYNEKDIVIGRDNSGAGSRIVCLGLNTDNGKFKNLKFEYFLKNNKLYCSYDTKLGAVYHFEPKDSKAWHVEHNDLEVNPQIINRNYYYQTFTYDKREDDYFFYLRNGWNCINDGDNAKLIIENNQTAIVHGVKTSDVESTDPTAPKSATIYTKDTEIKSIGTIEITGRQKEEISKLKVNALCKVFISQEEYYKYKNW